MEQEVHNKHKYYCYFGKNNPKLDRNSQHPNNTVITTKYNALTLVPKSLLMQFRRAANVYFLIITIMTFMPFSPKKPLSMLGTFAAVLIATMIKEAVEDLSRYSQDKKGNNKKYLAMKHGQWQETESWKLCPGDLIKLQREDEMPCDTIILRTSNTNGYCYIDTKNLDGETNLKDRSCNEMFKDLSDEQTEELNGEIIAHAPDEHMHSFEASMITGNDEVNLSLKNVILKGCVLKNTDFIIGVVCYTGRNTKIMQNSKSPKVKTSNVLITMNKLLYSMFVFDLSICLIFSGMSVYWLKSKGEDYTYIYPDQEFNSTFIQLILNFLTYIVAYSHMIPISLYVALEIVKISQAKLIKYDNDMFDFTIMKEAECKATELIEELGQVEFIFSDKTGTLTQNVMVLKRAYINNKIYGTFQEEDEKAKFTINGDANPAQKVRSNDESFKDDKKAILEFFYLLAVCHEVFPEKTEQRGLVYQGASPDDIALVEGARQFGIEFNNKDFSDLIIMNEIENFEKRFEILAILPFNSDRKRMSAIARDKDTGVVKIFTKGQDTKMFERCSLDVIQHEEISKVIFTFAKEGLRVLVLASKVLDDEFLDSWLEKYNLAVKTASGMEEVEDEIEKELEFVGCTAIEDKLQEGVPEAIMTLLNCGIRVWVLTGDKQTTALEIAKSCNLVNDNNMFVQNLSSSSKAEVTAKIDNFLAQFGIPSIPKDVDVALVSKNIKKIKSKDLSVIVDGMTLKEILDDQELKDKFFSLSLVAKSVVCCSVSPKQKSSIVGLAKNNGKWITLSIGDGANDVPMIMEAHIGVGIAGKEGTQAVRSSDFAIGQFRFLEKLLLIYGRNGYTKVSKFICYYFYKNMILIFAEILFPVFNGYSGQIFFADYLSVMYNAFFTSWPCMVSFALDRDVDLKTVKKFPVLYKAGPSAYFFNMKVFWTYILYSFIHGIICYTVPAWGLNNIINTNGDTLDHWIKSTVSFSMIIHVVTYKLLIITNFWHSLNVSASVISVLIYYIVIYLLNTTMFAYKFQNELAGIVPIFLTNIPCLIAIFAISLVCILPDYAFAQLSYVANPNPIEYIKQALKDQDLYAKIFKSEKKVDIFDCEEARNAEKICHKILTEEKKKKQDEMRTKINSRQSSGSINIEEKEEKMLLLPAMKKSTFGKHSDLIDSIEEIPDKKKKANVMQEEE